jgi:CRP-like cAMP-binding protein
VTDSEQKALSACPLFSGCKLQRVAELLKKAEATKIRFVSGEAIPFRKENKSRLGIVLDGVVGVYSKDEKRTPLNRLTPGCIFGLSSLYSDYDGETELKSRKTETQVLFIQEEQLSVFLEDPIICRNLIAFLTGRIRFLTEKITAFTSPTAEKKLAKFLEAKGNENGAVTSFRSYADLARSLNLGRASLYRALDRLTEDEVIEKDGKSIRIISRTKLSLYL